MSPFPGRTKNDWRLAAGLVVGVSVTLFSARAAPPTTEVPAAHSGSPHLSVDQPKIDLGTVQAGDIVPMSWRLKNTGDANLVISRIKPGCGCTLVNFSEKDQIIRPGKSLELEASFNSSGRRGEHDKKVIVYSNDPTQPEFALSFRAFVDRLFEVIPSHFVNLRIVKRGDHASRTIDVLEDPTRGHVTVLGVDVPEGTPLSFSIKPFTETNATGQRVTIRVLPSAAVGKLKVDATLQVKVGETVRTHPVSIRVEVVGDITWLPKVVDATRRVLRPGNTLAPINVRASSGTGFRVLRATAGDIFEVHVDPTDISGPAKRHRVTLTVRDKVPAGPFGTTLRIETDAPDQPVIEVPVYGNVMKPLEVDPPIVILRQDGTPAGTVRRLRLKTYPGSSLDITSYQPGLEAVSVQPASSAQTPQRHIRYLEVRLTGMLPPGSHDTKIIITTNVAGFDRVEIPVRVEVAR